MVKKIEIDCFLQYLVEKKITYSPYLLHLFNKHLFLNWM